MEVWPDEVGEQAVVDVKVWRGIFAKQIWFVDTIATYQLEGEPREVSPSVANDQMERFYVRFRHLVPPSEPDEPTILGLHFNNAGVSINEFKATLLPE